VPGGTIATKRPNDSFRQINKIPVSRVQKMRQTPVLR
jgi:hypothetical protein